jgi:hypothetical protein
MRLSWAFTVCWFAYVATITVDQNGGHHPNPAEFAMAAQQAAPARAASIVSGTRPSRSSASSQF